MSCLKIAAAPSASRRRGSETWPTAADPAEPRLPALAQDRGWQQQHK